MALFSGKLFSTPGMINRESASYKYLERLFEDCDAITDEQLLEEGPDAIAARLAAKHKLPLPQLRAQDAKMRDTPLDGGAASGSGARAKIECYIPFDGLPELFHVATGGPGANGDVRGQEIVLTYTGEQKNPGAVKESYLADLSKIQAGLTSLKHALDSHNYSLEGTAKRRLQERWNLLQQPDWSAVLNIPRRPDGEPGGGRE